MPRPEEAVVQVSFVLQAKLRGGEPVLRAEAGVRTQLAAQVLDIETVRIVDRDEEGHGEVLPLESDRGGVLLALGKVIGQHLVVLRSLRFRRHPQGIFPGVVGVAPPGGRVLGEDDRPLVRAGDEVQPVGPGGEALALDLDVVRGGEHRVRVGPAAPGTVVATGSEMQVGHPVGDELAPDLALPILARGAMDVRAAVFDTDADEADLLDDLRVLATAAGRQGDAIGLGRGGPGQAAEAEDRRESRGRKRAQGGPGHRISLKAVREMRKHFQKCCEKIVLIPF